MLNFLAHYKEQTAYYRFENYKYFSTRSVFCEILTKAI